MTLPFTLGIKRIVDSSINTSLKGAFEGPSETEGMDLMTIRMRRDYPIGHRRYFCVGVCVCAGCQASFPHVQMSEIEVGIQ